MNEEHVDDVTDDGVRGGVESCSVPSRSAAHARSRGMVIEGVRMTPSAVPLGTKSHLDRFASDRGEIGCGDLRYGDQEEPSDAPTWGSGVQRRCELLGALEWDVGQGLV